MQRKSYTIDATGKVLGRIAVQVAILLQGKDKPSFQPQKDEGALVRVKNVHKIKITGKKVKKKRYFHYTGFPGGLRQVPLQKVFERNPSELLKKAVLGMLPKNKLRAKRIKRLKFINAKNQKNQD